MIRKSQRASRASTKRLPSLQRATACGCETLESRMLLVAGPYHWPAGPEVQVNTLPNGHAPAMAMDADGDYVIVWTRGDVYAQRFNAAGVRQGGEIRVHTSTFRNEVNPAVAMDADGDFVVTYTRGYYHKYFPEPYYVYARRFSASGTPQGTEFLVSNITGSHQLQTAAAMDADGDFVVTWARGFPEGGDAYAQRFNAAGVPQGAGFVVNSYTPQLASFPAAAMDHDGDFVIAWGGNGLGGSVGTHARRFNAAGVAQGSQFLVSASSNRFDPCSIAMDADGDFVVAWQGSGIGGQRYNASGVPQGAMFGIEPSGAWRPGAPRVAMNGQGEFVVTWHSTVGDDTHGPGAYVQRFDRAGLPLGTQFRVNTAGNLFIPCVAIGSGGEFVVAAAATTGGIRARRYATFGPTDVATIGDRVWNDADADGIQGGGEVGIGGATIEFSTVDGAGIAIVTTNATGQYSVGALPGASTRLRFATPAGYLPTRPNRGTDDELDSDADRTTGLTPSFTIGAVGTLDNSWDAGFCLPASAGGIVFNDRNGTGIRDGIEEGLAGFEVFVDLDSDGAHDVDEPTDASDDVGRYGFTGLLGGVYPIVVVGQDLWVEPALPPVAIPPGAVLNQFDRPVRTDVPDRGSARQGPEFRVNSYTTGEQIFPSIAMAADGRFVLAWSGSGAGDDVGIFAQLYDASGLKLGAEFRVNTLTTGRQDNASAAMDGDGDFIIAWQGDRAGGYVDVYAQRYSAAGVAQGDEFRVNTSTATGRASPAVAMDGDGDFVIAWHKFTDNVSYEDVFAQRYSAAGVAQGDEFRVNASTASSQFDPTVAMDGDGDFVIAWSGGYLIYDVYAQRFNAAGVPQGGELPVSTSTLSDVTPAVAMDADGAFVVAWANGITGDYSSEFDVYAQRYNAPGTAQGTAVRVSRTPGGSNIAPAAAMNAVGDHVITWRSGGGISARRYNAAGVKQGGELHVNSNTTGAKEFPAAAIAAGGDFVVAWESYLQDGSGTGVYAQRYVTLDDPKAATVGDRVWNDTNGNGIQEAGEPGIAGAVVEFYGGDGVLTGSTKTDSAGRYSFAAPAGTSGYLRFLTPNGLIPTRRDRGADDELDSDADRVTGLTHAFETGAAGTANGSFDAGFVIPASVSGVVFFDRSGDGVRNGGDQPLSSFEIFADFDGDGTVDADEPVAVSGADGAYAITQLLGGTHPVTIIDQDQWVEPVLPPTTVPPGGNVAQVNFPLRTSARDSVSLPLTTQLEVTLGDKNDSQIAMDANGNYVIVWNSDHHGSPFGIYAQRYNSSGFAQGAEFRVNTTTSGDQQGPSIAIDADGDFVIAWSGAGTGDDSGVFAQRYNAAGIKRGTEFRVNSYTTGDQWSPSAAMDANGNFLIAWQSAGQDVYAQHYNAAGLPQGGEFGVSTSGTIGSASMDADGDFLIAWTGIEGSTSGIFAQRYNAAGIPQGSASLVKSGYQFTPLTAMDAAGNFVVCWTSRDEYGNGDDVFGQRYSAEGIKQGAQFPINSYTTGSQFATSVAMDAGGDFVVTWDQVRQIADGVYAQRFNSAGVPQGTQFQVNTDPYDRHSMSAAAVDADGDFVVTWSWHVEFGSGGIYARRYDVSARPAITASQFVWQTAPQRIEFTFDQDVSSSLSAADLVLHNQTTGATIPGSSIVMGWNAATRTATFRFPTLPNGGSLPDGRYRATLAAAGVTNAAGTTIAVDYALDFFVLAGDANRDARVNLADFNILAANFGQSGRDFTQGDFNYDGQVNLQDFNILAGRFGVSISPTEGDAVRDGGRDDESKLPDELSDLLA